MTYAVLDEAGDTGVVEGSSQHLVVAAVVVPALQPLRRAVLRVRKSLGRRLGRMPELKASRIPPAITTKLLMRLSGLDDIEIYTAVCKKGRLSVPDDPEDWYRRLCAEVVRSALSQHPRMIVTLDQRYTNPTLRDRLVEFVVTEKQKPALPGGRFSPCTSDEPRWQTPDGVAPTYIGAANPGLTSPVSVTV